MKRSTRNRVRGKMRAAKGKAKAALGRARKDPRLEAEGLDDQVAGKLQDLGGRIQESLED